MSKKSPHRPTAEEEQEISEAESRLDAHLHAAEQAHAEGRLAELIADVPPVRDQLQGLRDASA